jgi:ubiquinone/menaquinone biosynthesis C-methylase UbiE
VEFSQELIRRSGYARAGFADHYERFRPRPPAVLLEALCRVARTSRPQLVVDLGSGTGLSTRVWSSVAERVIGIEANPAMQAVAETRTTEPSVEYRSGFSHDTGLPDECADIVTCSQSLHWMEPEPTFAEVVRILRPGGAFGAYDYDMPLTLDPEVDSAIDALWARRKAAREARGLKTGAESWPKETHLARIRESGRFRYCTELVLHTSAEGGAEKLIGFARSLGLPVADGEEEIERELDYGELEETARRVLGDRAVPLHWGYRVRIGVR